MARNINQEFVNWLINEEFREIDRTPYEREMLNKLFHEMMKLRDENIGWTNKKFHKALEPLRLSYEASHIGWREN